MNRSVLMKKNNHVDSEMGVILGRFGDEESTLLDQYERLSFEIQLNQAILARSLSEPTTLSGSRGGLALHPPPPPPRAKVAHQEGRRQLGFQKFLNKLLKPILGGRNGKPAAPTQKDTVPSPRVQKDHRIWKTFSRSLRL